MQEITNSKIKELELQKKSIEQNSSLLQKEAERLSELKKVKDEYLNSALREKEAEELAMTKDVDEKANLSKEIEYILKEKEVLDKEKENIENQETSTDDIEKKRKIERERWALVDKRRELEDKRWAIEEKVGQLESQISKRAQNIERITENYSVEQSNIAELKQKTDKALIELNTLTKNLRDLDSAIDLEKMHEEHRILKQQKEEEERRMAQEAEELRRQKELEEQRAIEEARRAQEERAKKEEQERLEKEAEIARQRQLQEQQRAELNSILTEGISLYESGKLEESIVSFKNVLSKLNEFTSLADEGVSFKLKAENYILKAEKDIRWKRQEEERRAQEERAKKEEQERLEREAELARQRQLQEQQRVELNSILAEGISLYESGKLEESIVSFKNVLSKLNEFTSLADAGVSFKLKAENYILKAEKDIRWKRQEEEKKRIQEAEELRKQKELEEQRSMEEARRAQEEKEKELVNEFERCNNLYQNGDLDSCMKGFQQLMSKLDKNHPIYLKAENQISKIKQDAERREIERRAKEEAKKEIEYEFERKAKEELVRQELNKIIDDSVNLFDQGKFEESLVGFNSVLNKLEKINQNPDIFVSLSKDKGISLKLKAENYIIKAEKELRWRKQEEENKQRAEAEAKKRQEEERRAREEAMKKIEAERIAKEKAEAEAKKKAQEELEDQKKKELEIKNLFNNAVSLYNHQKIEESIVCFKKVMEKDPKPEKKSGLFSAKTLYEQAEEYLKKSEEALKIKQKKEAEEVKKNKELEINSLFKNAVSMYNSHKLEESATAFKEVLTKASKPEKKAGFFSAKSIYEQAEDYLKKIEQQKKEAEAKKRAQEEQESKRREVIAKVQQERPQVDKEKELEINSLFKNAVSMYNSHKLEESATAFKEVLTKATKPEKKAGFFSAKSIYEQAEDYLKKIEQQKKEAEAKKRAQEEQEAKRKDAIAEKKIEVKEEQKEPEDKQQDKKIVETKKEEKPKEVDISDLDLKF
ncbi:MAG: hypothetical protein PHV25_00355 [Candidatus Pacebacteria bacterium]|nr:hypothetical protein [Candidatus Paceibacterota bacterium]